MSGKLKINAKSIPWLLEIDEHVRRCNIRGPLNRFTDIAADPLDGWAMRHDLADLIRRGFLKVIRYGFDDSLRRDPMRDADQRRCGTSWSVNPTPKMIKTFWPERITP